MKAQHRNLEIDLLKFLYSWVIVFYHFFQDSVGSEGPRYFIGGYYGVEFYLLTAGAFLFLTYERQKERQSVRMPYQYLKQRFLRLFPWALTAFLFTVITRRILLDHVTSPGDLLDYFSGDIWEILLVNWNGMNDDALALNVPAWTLSAMLLVGFVIWCCLYFDEKRFLHFFMPVSLLLGYGLWRHIPVGTTQTWIGFTTVGTFRAWLAMNIGFYCVILARSLSQVPLSKAGRVLLTVGEVGLHVFCLWAMLNRDTRYYQWLVTLLLALAVAIALSGKSCLGPLLARLREIPFLGEISLSVYLTHYAVLEANHRLWQHMGQPMEEHIPLFVLLVLAFALLHYFLTKLFMKLCRSGWAKLRPKLLTDEAHTF